MAIDNSEKITIPVSNYEDVVLVRQRIRMKMEAMRFPTIVQTMMVTAVSELSRNIVIHAGKGNVSFFVEQRANSKGITCIFSDAGPGIANISMVLPPETCMENSVVLGLKGARQLSDDFSVESSSGNGTTVSITKWLR